eukprot:TRINITY_DN15212_c0_g1_i1.p1 TRINITY_DN15212_c0_g1~~TRINITY_DN15212_c0_g1_i1.p1  ORF type:complete len:101 (-),score=24.41 TRINITY_DN15212_c0_g1_i1:34-336(-)
MPFSDATFGDWEMGVSALVNEAFSEDSTIDIDDMSPIDTCAADLTGFDQEAPAPCSSVAGGLGNELDEDDWACLADLEYDISPQFVALVKQVAPGILSAH